MAPLKKTYELDSNSYSYNSEAIVPTIVTNVVDTNLCTICRNHFIKVSKFGPKQNCTTV